MPFCPAVLVNPYPPAVNETALPGLSVNEPKLVVPETPMMLAVPELVMVPEANGVPAVGRTLIPDHTRRAKGLGFPELPSAEATPTVMALELTAAVAFDNVKRAELLAFNRETVTVTVDVVSKIKPAGARRTIVPGAWISPLTASSSCGPVKVVYAPPTVSADTEALAKVLTVAEAKTLLALAKKTILADS